jgi:four helix bundle protein
MLEGVSKIKAWQASDKLAIDVYKVTAGFPHHEIYGLTSQMRRAAVSAAANIAEGAQRQFLKEYLQFLYVSKGSLSEVEYYVHLSHHLGYLSDAQANGLAALQGDAARTLHGLIRWLETQMAAGHAKKSDLPKQS